MAKAKRKTGRGKGNDGTLETILRFEIIVVLFSLIGLYYFLSFSPIRMPAEPIASLPEMIAPLPPQPEPQAKSGAEVESPDAGSVTVPATVAVVAPARSQEAGESLADAAAEAPSEKLTPAGGSDTDTSVSLEKSDSVDSDLQKPVAAALEKLPAVVPAPELNEGLAPETAVSASVSPVAPAAVQPESRPQTVLDSPVQSTAAPSLPPRTLVAGEYVLQVEILQYREKLEALNFKFKTKTVRRPTPMYRVYLGTFPQRKKAREMMDVVRKKGDEPFLQACSGGYNVVIASFYLHSSVVAWENMYHAAGFEPKVQKVTLEIPHTLLLLDGPAVQQDADAVLAKLKAAGFTDPHLK